MKAPVKTFRNPLCVAFDVVERDELDRLVHQLAGQIGLAKIGLAAFSTFGPSVIGEIARDVPVFVDLKLHDIPMQVRAAAERLADAGASLITVHASGGPHVVAAAVAGAGSVPVVGVTILTSIATKEFSDIGFAGTPEQSVVRLAKLAIEAGASGVVASPRELPLLRDAIGDEPIVVTPGIRGIGDATGDQARTSSAAEAIEAGADVVVVGRPITKAPDPAEAAARLLQEIG